MREPVWEFLIVNYLFFGGLSAGLYFVSGLAAWLTGGGRSAYPRIARWGALLAPWPVSLGSLLLIFDLGQPLRFWKLFLHFRWQSPMSIGSWLLVLFTLLSLAYLWSWLEQEERDALLGRVPEKLRARIPARVLGWLKLDASAWRRNLALLGFPLSAGVGIYTGVLLGAVQARPFWNTNLVAQLFLISALATGTALLIWVRNLERLPLDAREGRFLFSLSVGLLAAEFFIVIPYILHSNLSILSVQEALRQIRGGPYTLAFRVFEGFNLVGLGVMVLLSLENWEIHTSPLLKGLSRLAPRRVLAMGAAGLMLGAGFLLRHVFVFAGQASGFR